MEKYKFDKEECPLTECVVAMLLLLVWPVVVVGTVVDLCHGESQASKEDNCDFHGGC